MKTNNIFEKILAGEEITVEDRVEAARDLVADKVADILKREMVVAKLSGRNADIRLSGKECKDSDENLRRFLTIMGAKDIKVTSDFPWYNESYEWHTSIKFNY